MSAREDRLINTLVDGFIALAALDRHMDDERCGECLKYAGRLWRGEDPREFRYLRCEQAQQWQERVDAAIEIVRRHRPLP